MSSNKEYFVLWFMRRTRGALAGILPVTCLFFADKNNLKSYTVTVSNLNFPHNSCTCAQTGDMRRTDFDSSEVL